MVARDAQTNLLSHLESPVGLGGERGGERVEEREWRRENGSERVEVREWRRESGGEKVEERKWK